MINRTGLFGKSWAPAIPAKDSTPNRAIAKAEALLKHRGKCMLMTFTPEKRDEQAGWLERAPRRNECQDRDWTWPT
jgi:hypothetical protein